MNPETELLALQELQVQMQTQAQPGLADSMRRLRITFGYTQGEVADTLGMSRSSYSLYEAGKMTPCADTILDLSAFYGVNVTSIFHFDGDTTCPPPQTPDSSKAHLDSLLDIFACLSPCRQESLLDRAEMLMMTEYVCQ
jgi:transcriptional regulator with XRE-family HTH domain